MDTVKESEFVLSLLKNSEKSAFMDEFIKRWQVGKSICNFIQMSVPSKEFLIERIDETRAIKEA